MKILRGWGEQEEEVDPAAIDWPNLSIKTLDFRVRQEAGPLNVLGRIKFMFPNKYDVYLHDTPYQEDFAKSKRLFSHGCIRIEKPIEFARYLLKDKPGWSEEKILGQINENGERTLMLKRTIPIYILYCTAWQEDNGPVEFRRDVYGRDDKLDVALKESPPQRSGHGSSAAGRGERGVNRAALPRWGKASVTSNHSSRALTFFPSSCIF
jgi:murein L,D-transpeptidase YcbB/YkuD